MSYNPKQKALQSTYFQGEYVYNYGGYIPGIIIEPAPSPSPSPTPSSTITPTPTITPTKTPTPTPTPSSTPKISPIWSGQISRSGLPSFSTIYSYNGIDWFKGTTASNLIGTADVGGTKTLTNGYIFVMGGYSFSTTTRLAWSNDGIEYFAATNGASFGLTRITDMIWDGTRFIAIGENASTNDGYILESSDGKTWSSLDFFAGVECRSIEYDGSGLYVIGWGGISDFLQYTTDFITYTPATLPVSASSITDIVYGGGVWVAAGINAPSGSSVYFSNDGMTWNQASTSGLAFWTLMYDGGKFYGGYSTGIWVSSDGDTWTQVSSHNASGSIAYDGSVYVSTGTAGVYYSIDGATWSLVNPPAGTTGLPNTFSINSMPSPYSNPPIV